MPRHELRLLGGASILAADGRPVAGRATHRHRLALLAVLALARPAGVSRDKLAGLLWPERDEDAARHLLRTAIHDIRQALGAAALVTAGTEVRLDADHVPADVHRFEDALDAGDLARALSLHGGPFLDGFFLDDAQAFDEWASAQRARLARRREAALEALAAAAEERGDRVAAATRWRELAGARPADGRVAVRAVDALLAAGDPAGALAQAAGHARHLRDEYGIAPDAALRERVAGLRETLRDAAALDAMQDVVPDAMPDVVPDAAPAPDAAPPAPPSAPGPRAHRLPRRVRLAAVAAAAVVAVLLGAWTIQRRGGLAARDLPGVLAVAPFDVVGGAPAELRVGLADLLTTNLEQVAGVRTVPARASAARAALLARDGESDPARLARGLRSDAVVTGTAAPVPEGLLVRAALTAADGAVLARVEARGALADLPGLVDRVSVGLLREVWGRRSQVPASRLAAVSTTSAAALRAYLRGETFFRGGAWDSAATAFAEAVDLDSTFALANLRLAETDGWRNGPGSPEALRAVALARRHADRLPPRERGLLAVRVLHEAGDLAALDSARELVGRYPDDPDAQYARADTRYHARDFLGLAELHRTAAYFDTALALDPTSARALAHPIGIALELGDSALFDRTAARLRALASAGVPGVTTQYDYGLLRALRWATPAESYRTFLRRLPEVPPTPSSLGEVLGSLERAVIAGPAPRPDLLLAALDSARAFYARVNDPRELVEARVATWRAGTGRLGEARPALDALWATRSSHAPNVALLPVVFGYAPPSWHAPDARRLETDRRWGDTPLQRRMRTYWRALFALARGDAAAGRAALAALRVPDPAAPADSVPAWLAGAARAAEGWAVLLDGDTARALAEMDAGLRAAGDSDYALLLGRVPHARYLMLAAAVPQARPGVVDRLRFVATRSELYRWPWYRRVLADALEAEGERAEAAAERARFAALWAGADPGPRAAGARRDGR